MMDQMTEAVKYAMIIAIDITIFMFFIRKIWGYYALGEKA